MMYGVQCSGLHDQNPSWGGGGGWHGMVMVWYGMVWHKCNNQSAGVVFVIILTSIFWLTDFSGFGGSGFRV